MSDAPTLPDLPPEEEPFPEPPVKPDAPGPDAVPPVEEEEDDIRSPREIAVIALVLFFLLGGAGGFIAMVKYRKGIEKKTVHAKPPLVNVVTVAPRDHALSVITHASVLPRTESALVAQVSGRILGVAASFEEGGYFEAGDILVTLEPADYTLQLAQAEGRLAQAELRLAREEAEANAARQELRTIDGLEPDPLALREPQIKEARAAVAAAAASVKLAKLQLERTEIRAPFAGRVRTKQVDVGQVVAPGTPLARIYATDYAEVSLPLPLDELEHIDVGLGATDREGPEVTLRAAIAGKTCTWKGRIVRTRADIDPRTRMVHAVARVSDPYRRKTAGEGPPLMVGLFVTAEIRGRTVPKAVLLPREAIHRDTRVLVLEGADRLRFREVDVLRYEGPLAVVRSGLKAGERVCVSPLQIAVDNMEVRVHEEPEKP